MQESHTESFIPVIFHFSLLLLHTVLFRICVLPYLEPLSFSLPCACVRACLCVVCVRVRARAERARGTRALLALKIRATDICPGNAEACVQHVSCFKQKSHGHKLDS